jgi:hypothetical protein
MATKVQTDNEKILAAMVGQRNARKVRGQKAVHDGILGILSGTKTADDVLKEVEQSQTDEIIAETDAVLREAGREDLTITPKPRPMTAKERALSGRKAPEAKETEDVNATLTPEEIPDYKPTKTKRTPAPAKTAKAPRVLEDPVENAKLVRMRAKWTAIRRERDVARLEEEIEAAKTPAERKEVSGRMKTAKSVLVEAQVAEKKAYKAYRDLLEARQAEKKAAKTASSPAEAAVADPDDLDATINAQRESR